MKKLLVSIIFLFLTSFSYALTTGDIISQVRLLERDNNSANYRWTEQNLIDRINIIQDDICTRTFCLQTRYYITTSTDTREYRLPSDLINIVRVAYYITNSTDAYKKLAWTSLGGQDQANPFWQNMASGLPTEYYRRVDYIGLKPAPSSSYEGTDYVQLDYNVRASSVSSSTDIPLNGNYNLYGFHQAIIYGVAALCEFDKGNNANYVTLQTIYENWITKIKELYYTEPDKNINFAK